MTIEAWYMDDEPSDQRLPHKTDPVQPVSLEKLRQLGILYWGNLTGEDDETLLKIREERGYNYTDVIHCCPDKLPGYETKIISFFEEHIHTDEEIRYCMDGSGYFDIRDENDRWIRIALGRGDLIVLPEGVYHRFTNDENNYIKAMRLFQGEPVWTPYNRKDISPTHPSIVKYSDAFIRHAGVDNEAKRQKVDDDAEKSL